MLLGGGSFKTLPTCLSRAEGMFSLVTSLIDIPSSQGVTHGERGGEEFLLRPGETLGEEGMQLLGILHTHLKSPKSSLAGYMLRPVGA